MVSISHDWKAQMDIIDNNEAYEDPNQTLTLKMAKASELASELSGMRLFPTYQEVGTLYLNPLESIEPKKVTAIPIKGFSVSYKIRNSLLVKNLLNDRPLNVLNETQSRFNNSAYMTTSKKDLCHRKLSISQTSTSKPTPIPLASSRSTSPSLHLTKRCLASGVVLTLDKSLGQKAQNLTLMAALRLILSD